MCHSITAPEAITLSKQIEEAESLINSIKKQLKVKSKELDKIISDDTADLFGERKSEPTGTQILFSERVNPKRREVILQPIKNSLKTAENELVNLLAKKDNLTTTGKLF